MSLECRTCGEKLPLVVLTDAEADPVDVPILTETIWKTEAPLPALFDRADDGVVVTVHGGNAPAPVFMEHDASKSETGPALEVIARAEPVAPAAPIAEIKRAPTAKKSRAKKPTVIERLHGAQPTLKQRPRLITEPAAAANGSVVEAGEKESTPGAHVAEKQGPVQAAAATPAKQHTVIAAVEPTAADQSAVLPPAELTAESDNEIEVSAEAETLVEACVAPLTFARPEEVSAPEAPQVDQIATQLREGAWRTAMSIDPSPSRALAPARLHAWPRRGRRLSMQRVGLAVAGAGAMVAIVYSVHLASSTADSAQPQAAVPAARPISLPVRTVAETAPAAALATTTPVLSVARTVEPPASPPSSAPSPAVEKAPEKPAEKTLAPATVAASAPAEVPAPVARSTPLPLPAAAPVRRSVPLSATPTETIAPTARASRASAEAPRPCTQAVAALGLCSSEATTQ